MDPVDQAYQVRMVIQRLAVLDAVVLAQNRYAEVSAAIAGSADRDAARSVIARLLGVDAHTAARADRDEVIAHLRGAGVEPTSVSTP